MRTGSSYAIQSEVPPIFTEWKVALMVLFRASPWASAPKGMREACLVTEQRLWRPEAAGVARKRSERRVQIHENNGSTPHLRVLRLHGGQCGPPPPAPQFTEWNERVETRLLPTRSGSLRPAGGARGLPPGRLQAVRSGQGRSSSETMLTPLPFEFQIPS